VREHNIKNHACIHCSNSNLFLIIYCYYFISMLIEVDILWEFVNFLKNNIWFSDLIKFFVSFTIVLELDIFLDQLWLFLVLLFTHVPLVNLFFLLVYIWCILFWLICFFFTSSLYPPLTHKQEYFIKITLSFLLLFCFSFDPPCLIILPPHPIPPDH